MKGTREPIDYLDLAISIPAPSREALSSALEKFIESYLHVERPPKFSDGVLSINSNDFIALLGYLNPSEYTEFERKRIEKNAIEAIDQQLLRCVKLAHREHYKWCLAAIKNFAWGRFLEA